MKCLVVEPHEDDALLSCMHVLENPQLEVTLLSCYGRNKELRQSSHLVEEPSLSVKHHEYLNVELEDLHWDLRLKDNQYDSIFPYFMDYYHMYPQRDLLYDSLEKYFTSTIYDVYFFPVGIQHPFHILVGSMIIRLINSGEFPHIDTYTFYEEIPYKSKKRWKKKIDSLLSNRNRYNTLPSSDKKVELFKKYYKTEMQLFRFYTESIRGEESYVAL